MNYTKVKSVEKTLKIIEYLHTHKKEKRITDIAKNLKINTSTVQRIINTLREENYLYQDSANRKYKLGLKFLEISKNILEEIDLKRVASTYLSELRDQTNETVHLMLLDNVMGVYIDAFESHQRNRVVSSIGTREDLYYSAAGKAILAYLSDSEIERIIKIRGLKKKTHKTITNLNILKHELENIRIQHYSTDDEEGEIGTKCIGTSIFSHNGKVNSSISISAPCHRLTEEKINSFIPLLLRTGRKISIEMGFKK